MPASSPRTSRETSSESLSDVPKATQQVSWQTRNWTLTRGDGMRTGDRAEEPGGGGTGHLGVFSGGGTGHPGAVVLSLVGTGHPGALVLRRGSTGHPGALVLRQGHRSPWGSGSQAGRHRSPWGSGSQAGRHRSPWGCGSQAGQHRSPWGCGSQAGWHRSPWGGTVVLRWGGVSGLGTWEPWRLGPAQLLCSGYLGLQERSGDEAPCSPSTHALGL